MQPACQALHENTEAGSPQSCALRPWPGRPAPWPCCHPGTPCPSPPCMQTQGCGGPAWLQHTQIQNQEPSVECMQHTCCSPTAHHTHGCMPTQHARCCIPWNEAFQASLCNRSKSTECMHQSSQRSQQRCVVHKTNLWSLARRPLQRRHHSRSQHACHRDRQVN